MSQLNLDLSSVLPPSPPPRQPLFKVVVGLQLLCLAALALLLFWRRPAAPAGAGPEGAAGLTREQLLELARRMEDLDLPRQSVDLWRRYLADLDPAPEKRAKLLYRMGVICQKGRLYQDAVAYFAQSEAVCKVDALAPEIGRRTQDCLEQLGLFSARSRDLQRRTDLVPPGSGAPAPGAGPVLAEIGAWRITRRDLEQAMEQAVEDSCLDGQLPPAELNRRKKAILKALDEGDNLARCLQDFVFEELLTREARERKLTSDPDVLRRCRTLERQLLRSAVLEKAVGDPRASDPEAEAYYHAHPDEFKKDDHQQEFPEVRQAILERLSRQKRQDARRKLFESLVDKYDVTIHTAALPRPTPPASAPAAPAPAGKPAPSPAPPPTNPAPAPAGVAPSSGAGSGGGAPAAVPEGGSVEL